ncbi:MAG: DUF481 domain-containing protein [bacterium]
MKLAYEVDQWLHEMQLDAVNSSDNEERTAESYGARWKTNYSYSDDRYSFIGARYEENRFSGYEYQGSVTTGYGIHLIDDEVTKFDVEAGIGYRSSEEQDTGEILDEAIAVAALQYNRVLTDTTVFESEVNLESGKDNTYLESILALKVAINSRLALKLGYTVKHNTDVPEDTDKTDTLTTVSLNYHF